MARPLPEYARLSIPKAVEIVLDLARQNVVDERDNPKQHLIQTEAIKIVESVYN